MNVKLLQFSETALFSILNYLNDAEFHFLEFLPFLKPNI